MSMKPSLGLNLSQSLVITPQLQQAIYLLQLSTLDLQQEIQQALESNPLLELEEQELDDTPAASSPLEDTASHHQDSASDESSREREVDHAAQDDWQETSIPQELEIDTVWDDIYTPESSGSSSAQMEEDREDYASDSQALSLQDHLLWQLNLNVHHEPDRLIGEALIDSINSDGYLLEDLAALTEALKIQEPDLLGDLELEDVQAVLKLIQHFDPTGVGARDLRECLLLQLEQLPSDTPWRSAALRLTDQYLEVLANRDYRFLQRRLRLNSEAELQQVIQLIQSLHPRPGSRIESEPAAYVIPDLLVTRTELGWRVELNPESQPKLRIQSRYSDLIRRADHSETNVYLKEHLKEAQWLIKSLQSRSETLLKVGSKIVERQQEFFEHGEEYMKPMILADIAQAIDMHESTISRATTQKYMHTPKGIFELKYFFSSHVATAQGGEASSTAIRAMLKKLINNEPPKKPLSDNKLAELLAEAGIQIARRTIAKYREAMNIPPSSERKRLG
ncbi:RNA polymerase factor sigma-54 [Marinospirillum sp. MEB164]|uniref:RNA polymerase sigma-54 factor n=1 Tax=Marinospirillum alkalitolerans TaxID=3123374 RepID=A0ABW8PXG0_9GAMM